MWYYMKEPEVLVYGKLSNKKWPGEVNCTLGTKTLCNITLQTSEVHQKCPEMKKKFYLISQKQSEISVL